MKSPIEDLAGLKLAESNQIPIKLALLEAQYQLCLSVIQEGVWYQMHLEKLVMEESTYAKVEYLRVSERLKAHAQEGWEKGKDFYPTPSKPLSVE